MTEYRSFEIEKLKPSRRYVYRIHKNGCYMHSSSTMKKAKRLIDFCLRNKVEGWV